MRYHVVTMNEWLYPDSTVPASPVRKVSVAAARGTRAASQILLTGLKPDVPLGVRFEPSRKGSPEPEVFQLVDVMVEANTGPVGFTVRNDRGESAEGYTTRRAPFRAYDAMKPLDRDIRTRGRTEAIYVSWRVPVDAEPGKHGGTLTVAAGDDSASVPITLEVFPATVPECGTFRLTNWFSVGIMAERHGLEMWYDAHWRMIRAYAKLMRRGRQTDFLLPMGLIDVKEEPKGTFSFSWGHVERLIRMFFDLGFTHINGGHVATRTQFDAPNFVLSAQPKLDAVSREGYTFLAQYLTNWWHFLRRNGWQHRTIQHVGDEPTKHSAKDYRILSGIVRKFMPGVPIIDAVELPDLAGAVDIWVPKNSYYEEHRDDFEAYRSLGDTIWCYTCCFPGGRYMNRLLDMPLIRTRQIHWGCFLYDIPGFLHWGFNHYRHFQNPFEMNCPDHGGGNNLPPGDTHIVYPGDGEPWGSVRLEAQAAGIEDYELLRMLAETDRAKADGIVRSSVRGFKDSDEDPAQFAATHRRLLREASKAEED